MTSTPRRRRLASQQERTYSGLPLTPSPLPSAPRTFSDLCRQSGLIPAIADRLPDKLLIASQPVDIGRIEEVHPQVQGTVDRSDRFLLVARTVEFRQPHAPQAHPGHRKAAP